VPLMNMFRFVDATTDRGRSGGHLVAGGRNAVILDISLSVNTAIGLNRGAHPRTSLGLDHRSDSRDSSSRVGRYRQGQTYVANDP